MAFLISTLELRWEVIEAKVAASPHSTDLNAMPIDVVFVLPAGSDQVSGGNLYNQWLTAPLVRDGKARVTTIGACRAIVERGAPGFYFIDSLDLAAFVDFPVRPGQHFGLIVHHLASFEPDRDPADAAIQLEHATLPRFEVFLATSPLTADLLRDRGHAAKKILTVVPATRAVAAKLPNPAPPFVFSAVGNLIQRKGQLELLQELARQILPADQFVLELVGRSDIEPEYARACLALAQQSESLRSRVRYLGPVAHDEIAHCFRRAAAFVSGSNMETFGMALQEARAHGLPILALDGGYTRHHFTPGESGLLFESIASLAQGVLRVVREPERLNTLFDAAQRLRPYDDYSWEDAARLFLEGLTGCTETSEG